MKLGITRYLESSHPYKNIGIFSHANVLDESAIPVYEKLIEHYGSNIKALFGPQHGFFMNTSQAMMVPTPSSTFSKLNIPVHSLYRKEGRHVEPEWLTGLDAVLVDLPDVGVKVYTYHWSVAHMLTSCAEAGIPVIVLDRPNPIAGFGVLGPVTHPDFTSFVGLYPIAFCHAMTLGEVATYLNSVFKLNCQVEVIPMQGWHRDSFLDEYPMPWFNPSPNLRTMEALLQYPATVMIEATNVSEGRGTPDPFCCLGAPFIKGTQLAEEIQELNIPGIQVTATQFTPTSDKYQGKQCEGISLRCTDRKKYDPVYFGCALIWTLSQLYSEFAFRDPPYEYEYVKNPFDITVGVPQVRTLIQKHAPLKEIKEFLRVNADPFVKTQRSFLLY